MHDPIGSFERIREFYISYLDTAFRIADPSVADERRRLLRSPGTLCTDPLIEPIARYESADTHIHEWVSDPHVLKGFNEAERRAFVALVLAGLFPSRVDSSGVRRGAFKPYRHQVTMLERGMAAGQPGIVTTGTGSGKTESFLLPVLATIAREAVTWDPPAPGFLQSPWWHGPDGRAWHKPNKKTGVDQVTFTAIPRSQRPTKRNPTASPFISRRDGERRPAAVRALILYPMNALVEDQMVRLRKALDSAEARAAMSEHFHDNRVFFGRYTSHAPVTGHHRHPGLEGLLNRDPGVETTYFPDHPKADPTSGRVELQEVKDDEIERRQRALEKLFDFMVDAEDGQAMARLHAVDAASKRSLDTAVAKHRDANGDSPDAPTFVALARGAGPRAVETLIDDFRAVVGREPDDSERRALESMSLQPGHTDKATSATGDDAPFLFPAVDGGELVSRWDMQAHPPDLLITNVSMLSAMLSREVDAAIFDKTREWLEWDDAYFFLVLDELHLQRGSAGTEVSHLIRLLLHRLGLTSAEQRKKLRVLASSASLPDSPADEATRSAQYLWDMFGAFGIRAIGDDDEGKRAWLESIVSGRQVMAKYSAEAPPKKTSPEPFAALLRTSFDGLEKDSELPRARPASPRLPVDDSPAAEAWRAVSRELVPAARGVLSDLIRASIVEASERLAWACWDPPSGRVRAQPTSDIAERIFEDSSDRAEAIRGLLLVRGCGDAFKDELALSELVLPSFRVHTFFRSIEGLYAPAFKNLGVTNAGAAERGVDVGALTIEREPRTRDGAYRQFELLYCEACGDLFFGGIKGVTSSAYPLAELLPHEPLLDGLPDRASSQRFEDQTFDGYGVFWPRTRNPKVDDDIAVTSGGAGAPDTPWVLACLERKTGGIKPLGKPRGMSQDDAEKDPDLLIGRYYDRLRQGTRSERHKRAPDAKGTHVPYACPSCGTSYAWRQEPMRLSPIRNFRAGFGKTTQLLATELFDAQRSANLKAAPKLVSFSDSRQDAAKAALSIEKNHHQDARREALVSTLLTARAGRENPAAITEQMERKRKAIAVLKDTGFGDNAAGLEQDLAALTLRHAIVLDPCVELGEVLEAPSHAALSFEDGLALSFISRMVRSGVHPFDDAGLERVKGKSGDDETWFEWTDMFHLDRAGSVRWAEDKDRHEMVVNARQSLVQKVYESLVDVIFSKTYFSLEESGLGFPMISGARLPGRDRPWLQQLAALLRVIGDAYRFKPNPYGDDDKKPWTRSGDVSMRVHRFAEQSWPGDPDGMLDRALQDLSRAGHANAIIQIDLVAIQLVNDDETYFRCSSCGRVHLHLGTGICTRCVVPLPVEATGRVRELHVRNFLSRRVARALEQSDPGCRLHCEELTGQTDDPAIRQREFKGIFVPSWEEVEADADNDDDTTARAQFRLEDEDQTRRTRAEIDLLTVTTTMEVGIDIGPLQVVMQANMPPQRFNYQQRVGRAGRRGQAFSMALTICRTKSHDLHYFREPKKMTGDVPPTPFLTKDMVEIGLRFVRKAWLGIAFDDLRRAERHAGRIHPADLMVPPDIHGEFLPVQFWPSADSIDWRDRLLAALKRARPRMDDLVELIAEYSPLDPRTLKPSEADLIAQLDHAVVDSRERGLAHAVAERGWLPMYGMPTRVRDLYLRLERNERSATGRREWVTVDRDLDLAIYEFAPGSTVVLDKREHRCVGFTPSLAPPRPSRQPQLVKAFQEDALGAQYSMIECGHCHAWAMLTAKPAQSDCLGCGNPLDLTAARTCRVPNAFRTNFRPKPRQEEVDGGVRHRSIQAEGSALNLPAVSVDILGGGAIRLDFKQTAQTFRLNRGPSTDRGQGFVVEEGQQLGYPFPGVDLPHQVIASDHRHEVGEGFQPSTPPTEPLWLAAPKTTDALYLSPSTNPPGIALHRLPVRSDATPAPVAQERWLGIRAAAISAQYILVNRASLELDVDPDEFDVLEPRIYGHGEQLPLLQITDHLVNGAGFCRRLWADDPATRRPWVAELIRSILQDTQGSNADNARGYPREKFELPSHAASCDSACYRCLLRYGNQSLHGLLDWRLGMVFVRAMVDPAFTCGLDGDETAPGLIGWSQQAATLAKEMATRFKGESGCFEGIHAFRIEMPKRRSSPWMLVAHPLWDFDHETGPSGETRLVRAYEAAMTDEGPPGSWDTFNLSRRQVLVRERIRTTTVPS